METDKLLTISEFSSLTGIKIANLRYYDKINILKPAFRTENNYRFYTYFQLNLAYVIVSLRNMNISLETIKKYIQSRTPQKALKLFKQQINIVEQQIDKLQQSKEIMLQYMEDIEYFKDITTPKIELIEKANEIYCLGPLNTEKKEKFDSIIEFLQLCRENGINLINHIGKIFSKEAMIEKKWNGPNQFYIKNKKGNYKTEDGFYVVMYNREYELDENTRYKILYDFIEKNNLEICGEAYEDYPLDKISVSSPDSCLVRISIKVKKIKS